MQDYNIYANHLRLKFKCPKCGKDIDKEIGRVAKPDWEGDSVASSQNIEDNYFDCEHCHNIYNAETIANIYYGEIRLMMQDSYGHEKEIDEFIVIDNEEDEEENMESKFNEWFSEQVKTQYGDMKGIAYLDGHEGPGEVVKMIKAASTVNVNEYAILGFGISGFEPVGEHIYASVYAVDKRILEAKGSVDNLDFISDIEEFPIEDFNWEILRRYIKRLSIGFILPEHLRDMNKE